MCLGGPEIGLAGNGPLPFPEQVEMLRKCFIKREEGGGITSGLIDMIMLIKNATALTMYLVWVCVVGRRAEVECGCVSVCLCV